LGASLLREGMSKELQSWEAFMGHGVTLLIVGVGVMHNGFPYKWGKQEK
jgi:hypothetical protein